MGSSNPALEVSVSFGRFENDSLSWEKWSTFSPNKYLEEVEKCATPGSVAKKKAYFEEHYKKIAARKAELLAQERPVESKSFNSDDQNCGDPIGESNVQCSVEGDKQEINLVSEVNGIHYDEPNEEPEIGMDCQNSSVEGLKEEIDSEVEIPKLKKPEETAANEAVLVKPEVETLSNRSQDVKELPQRSDKDKGNDPKIKDKKVKLGHSAKSHKVTPVNQEKKETGIKKKSAASFNKIPEFSTPRASKPTSTPNTSSASRIPLKTGNTLSYSLPKTKNPSVFESKKVAPRPLHMSLGLGSSGSRPTSVVATRKSLIMEKMGDTDIIKRASKTFQNNYNQLKPSSLEQSPATKQVPAKGREPRFSTLTTLQEESGGSSRVSAIEKKNAEAPSSYFGLKNDEMAERRKEFSRKLQEKSNVREVEGKYLQTKSKDNRGRALIIKLLHYLVFIMGRGQQKALSIRYQERHPYETFASLGSMNHALSATTEEKKRHTSALEA